MVTEKMIDILIKELKQQHEWRLEDSECGSYEIAESWDILKYRIAKELVEVGCDKELYEKVLAI